MLDKVFATAFLESLALQEAMKEVFRETVVLEVRLESLRESVLEALEVRFGSVPTDRVASLNAVTDEARLKVLHRLAATCPDIEAFVTELTAGP